MSPGEKCAYNIILVSFLILLLSAVFYYLPSALSIAVYRLSFYLTGTSKLHITDISAAGMLNFEKQRGGDGESYGRLKGECE
jgi:hypothetical protein